MMTETAQVVTTDADGYAWVETQRKTACGSCAVQQGCGTGVLAKVLGKRVGRMRVRNTLGAAVGQRVVIGLEDGLLVRTSFAVYAVPLILLLLGGIAGGVAADALQWSSREGATAIGGVLGLLLGFAWLARYAQAIARDARHQANMIGFADEPSTERFVALEDIRRDHRRI